MTASTQDAQGKIFPLALCVADSKNDDLWKWFFEQLRIALGVREKLCIISDKHESIVSSVKNVYPEASHMFSTFHILNNLKTGFKKNAT